MIYNEKYDLYIKEECKKYEKIFNNVTNNIDINWLF